MPTGKSLQVLLRVLWEIGVLWGVLPRVLREIRGAPGSACEGAQCEAPHIGHPRKHLEHPLGSTPRAPRFPRAPSGALSGALPSISQLAPLCQARAIASGGMEWLGVWNCIFSGSELFSFRRSLNFGEKRSFRDISRILLQISASENILQTLDHGHSIRHQSIPPLSAG